MRRETIGPGGPGPTSPWSVISRVSTIGERVPVAGLIRVSTDDLQDPVGSATRQVGNCLAALPAGWEVVVWFIDIESGRMEFDERGTGTAHLNLPLPVERAGGLPDLLAEAKRPGCRFAAVICENAERMARYVYFNTRIEYELAKHGIELFASDEPIDLDGKKAAKVLLRRIKQAVGEWTVINTFEQAWDGLKTHTTSGYNIGRAPYGYRTQSHREGTRVKSKLVVDEVCGPVVTQIFRWRVDGQLTHWQIADLLNSDLDRYPPPEPTRKNTAVGAWTWSAVRGILANPKYTGHMVWNRTTTRTGVTVRRKKSHRPNPADQWVWSPTPTHTALVALADFQAAGAAGDRQRGHRPGHEPNVHPATKGTYVLRGYLRHQQCGRRLAGTRRGDRTYYGCHGPRNTRGQATMADHPGTFYVREDMLLPAVHEVIAERVFGAGRRTYLSEQDTITPRRLAEAHAEQVEATRRALDDIAARQDNIATELEETPKDHHAWRTKLRERFNELETQRTEAQARLDDLVSAQPKIDTGDPAILDAMPQVQLRLADLPEPLQRKLFDILNLEVTMPNTRQAHIKLTLTRDTPTLARAGVHGAPTNDQPTDKEVDVDVNPHDTRTIRDDAYRPVLGGPEYHDLLTWSGERSWRSPSGWSGALLPEATRRGRTHPSGWAACSQGGERRTRAAGPSRGPLATAMPTSGAVDLIFLYRLDGGRHIPDSRLS